MNPANNKSNFFTKLSVKLQYKEDLRRVALSATTFDALTSVIREVFPKAQEQEYHVKFVDEENDLISIVNDYDLQEALSVAVKKNVILKLFILTAEEASPKPNFAKNPEPSVASSSSSSSSSPNANTPFPEILNFFTSPIHSSFLEKILPALDSSSEQFASLVSTIANEVRKQINTSFKSACPASGSSSASAPRNVGSEAKHEKTAVVHGAICDNCEQQIQGIRYKCVNCNDFDLCDRCESLRPHAHEHLFLKIYEPLSICTRKPLLSNLYQLSKFRFRPRHHHLHQQQDLAIPSTNVRDDSFERSFCPRRMEHRNRCFGSIGRNCSDDHVTSFPKMEFVTDVTVPDGSYLAAGTRFTKVWRVRNSGTQTWPKDIRLVHVSGPALAANGVVPVMSIGPQEDLDIQIDMCSPDTIGRCVSHWRLSSSDGSFFGPRIWVDIVVVAVPFSVASASSTATATATTTTTTTTTTTSTSPSTESATASPDFSIHEETATSENAISNPVPSENAPLNNNNNASVDTTLVNAESMLNANVPRATLSSDTSTTQCPVPSEDAATRPAAIQQSDSASEEPSIGVNFSNLQKLEELGFLNRARNIQLLLKNKGNLVQCVVELLDEDTSAH